MSVEEITGAMNGLEFVGAADGSRPKPIGSLIETARHEVSRLENRLQRTGRDLGSLLMLDVLYEVEGYDPEQIERGLADALPPDCRPCVLFVEVSAGALAGQGLAMQAVSAADQVMPRGGRFPPCAEAGPVIAVAPKDIASTEGMTRQTHAVIKSARDLLAGSGATLDDVVRCDVFYLGQGTREDWAVNARVRAGYFAEPGPATTGIPARALAEGTLITVRMMAVRDARQLGLRHHSWPTGHWDWPIHLPFKHGCQCAGPVFVGGQVSLDEHSRVINPGDLDLQTRESFANIVRVIEPLGKRAEDLTRLVAFYRYVDESSPEVVGLALRDGLEGHEVALTFVGLPQLAYPEMVVEIQAETR